MAALCKRIFPDLCVISRGIFSDLNISARSLQVRTLYSQNALGIDNYVKARENVHTQFAKMASNFKSKMKEYTEPNSTSMIFTEDLKHMIHLVEPVPEDLDLIMKMMKRFNQQNQELRFGSFVFGPVVMRMYHFLDKPQEALEAFKDPDLDGFFDQLMSYQVLMDLLYNNEMYDQVLEVYDIVKAKQLQNAKYPKNVITLALAACYKLNSAESLKYALALWKELQSVGHIPTRRSATFAAALALNQNSPHISLEIISSVKQQAYVTVRNIKAAALADIGRPEDSLPILRSVLQVDDPAAPKQNFTKEVVQKVKEAIQRLDNKSLSYEFEQLENLLSKQGHVTNQTLDDHLCTEIVRINNQNIPQSRDRRFLAASFNRQKSSSEGRSYARPGLKDLY